MAKARIAPVIAALAVLAACGGSAEPAKEKAPPPPKVYTAAQLEAAMPADKDIPNATKVGQRCPGDKDCQDTKDIAAWSVDWQPKPALKGADAERAAHDAWFNDVGYLYVSQAKSESAVDKAYAESLKLQTDRQGPYETKAKKLEEEGHWTPGQKGTGTVDDVTISGWSGFVAEQSMVLTDLEGGTSEDRQEAQVRVRHGVVMVAATVSIGAKGRTAGDALTLARSVVEDYLNRLG